MILLNQLAPKFSISSSLDSIFTSTNVIAAAASLSSSDSLDGATTSTITQVTITAVAIASRAYLSTKVDYLWPKSEEQPEAIDVSGYSIFSDPKVQKAIAFAKQAHHGQFCEMGDPYLTHCIHTRRILAMLVPSSGKRLHSIKEQFGDDVARLVAGVFWLIHINQLLQRHGRINVNKSTLVMFLGIIDDPRVVLIKHADRLHNMRTIYALPLPKAQAVAKQTLVIWCSLASRLGLWALKAELEDLCFAVLLPQMFQKLRADLASLWSPTSRVGNSKNLCARANLLPLDKKSSICEYDNKDATNMKDLLEVVLPFDVLVDRGKCSRFLTTLGKNLENQTRPKVVQDAGIALASLVVCQEALQRELIIST
ncbi:hypothetical protein UlMin_037548 [Ulmus minor]